MVAAKSIAKVIDPPGGGANWRALKYMCLALSRIWIASWRRVYGTAATRRNPSCTITTAPGSWYCQKLPSSSGNPAGIQSPSPVTIDANCEYSISSSFAVGSLMEVEKAAARVSHIDQNHAHHIRARHYRSKMSPALPFEYAHAGI